MKKNLGLVFGGRSGEHEVSLQSAKSIAGAVNKDKYNLFMLAIDKAGDWYLADENNYLINPEDPSTIALHVKPEQAIAIIPHKGSNKILSLTDGKELGSIDVIFPIVHGHFGEDGGLQGFCDILNLPCVGPDVLGSAVAMDKVIAKQLLLQAGISVADYVGIDKQSDIVESVQLIESKFNYPVFVKPSCSGSSVGVYKAKSKVELEESIIKALAFDKKVLVEEAILGREIECALLGNTDLLASVPGEVIPQDGFYSYDAKYIDEKGAKLELPANLPNDVVERVKEFAIKTYRTLSCSGMARVDMFLTPDGELVLNEINTLPGFTKISMYPKLIELSGIGYSELIDELVLLATEQHMQRQEFLDNILKLQG